METHEAGTLAIFRLSRYIFVKAGNSAPLQLGSVPVVVNEYIEIDVRLVMEVQLRVPAVPTALLPIVSSFRFAIPETSGIVVAKLMKSDVMPTEDDDVILIVDVYRVIEYAALAGSCIYPVGENS
jgi:hypothetical protein